MTDTRFNKIEAAILERVHERAPGATICPSDVARGLWSAQDWRSHMEDVRAAAARLVEAGEIVATQQREVVDIRTARGPIRLGRRSDDRA